LLLEGVLVTREDLLVALIGAVDRNCALAPYQVLERFALASTYVAGKRVRVDDSGRNVEGVTCGLDPAGFLRLREDNGTEMTILAGGVRPV
jgi:BirA family biotin operon repressor/biotin-[acetyl-CoA-carboxylase] ligase